MREIDRGTDPGLREQRGKDAHGLPGHSWVSAARAREAPCPLFLAPSQSGSPHHSYLPLLNCLFLGRLNLLIENILAIF